MSLSGGAGAEGTGFERITREVPPHLSDWTLPPGWRWGGEGASYPHRHVQEVVDVLGRSLALVTAPLPEHTSWLEAEARLLAHTNHPSIPTVYHYWGAHPTTQRGPGYLRRWIVGESAEGRIGRAGTMDPPSVIQLLRGTGSVLVYLHDLGTASGALSAHNMWLTPTGRLWMLGWEWIVPRAEIPTGLWPAESHPVTPPEWEGGWMPSPLSDQWLLGALCFKAITSEDPPSRSVPPIRLVNPEFPEAIAEIVDRALRDDPNERFRSVVDLLRAVDRVVSVRTPVLTADDGEGGTGGRRFAGSDGEEQRVRWAVGDDYEILALLGRGSYGTVWRARDLRLGREVALKVLHPHVARDLRAGGRFRREARLAAQLSHPSVVPIYDWDSRGDVSWYTMELAEGGSVAELVSRSGPRKLSEIAEHVNEILDGLSAGHALGIIHRDLKPENVLIDRYGRWRIADFGIANVTGELMHGTSGTPAFAAPEQLLGEPQGPPSDCYAVAALVYFLLSGNPPFGSADPLAVLARQLSGKVDLTDFDPPLAAWIRRGLASTTALRFSDAEEMRAAWLVLVSEHREERVPLWRQWLT